MKKLSIILMLLLALAMPVQAAEGVIVTPGKCIGHRGAMDLAPQNTLASFQAAKNAGYGKFECDVWYTDSGEFIVGHDANIKSMTGKDLPIWKVSTKNRKKYPIIYGKNVKMYPTQYYPTIQEVLAKAKALNMKPLFHLKKNGSHTFTATALKKLNTILTNYKGEKKPIVFTSDKTIVEKMQKYSWKKGFLTSATSGSSLRSAFSYAKNHSCKYVIHPFSGTKPTKADLKNAHSKNLTVMCYQISTNKLAGQALELGEDYLITNNIVFD